MCHVCWDPGYGFLLLTMIIDAWLVIAMTTVVRQRKKSMVTAPTPLPVRSRISVEDDLPIIPEPLPKRAILNKPVVAPRITSIPSPVSSSNSSIADEGTKLSDPVTAKQERPSLNAKRSSSMLDTVYEHDENPRNDPKLTKPVSKSPEMAEQGKAVVEPLLTLVAEKEGTVPPPSTPFTESMKPVGLVPHDPEAKNPVISPVEPSASETPADVHKDVTKAAEKDVAALRDSNPPGVPLLAGRASAELEVSDASAPRGDTSKPKTQPHTEPPRNDTPQSKESNSRS